MTLRTSFVVTKQPQSSSSFVLRLVRIGGDTDTALRTVGHQHQLISKQPSNQQHHYKSHLCRLYATPANNKNINSTNKDELSYTTSIRNTIFYIVIAIIFGAALWLTYGQTVGEEFFAGYIVEKSLSVDNLFVFLLLFDFFRVPEEYQGVSCFVCDDMHCKSILSAL